MVEIWMSLGFCMYCNCVCRLRTVYTQNRKLIQPWNRPWDIMETCQLKYEVISKPSSTYFIYFQCKPQMTNLGWDNSEVPPPNSFDLPLHMAPLQLNSLGVNRIPSPTWCLHDELNMNTYEYIIILLYYIYINIMKRFNQIWHRSSFQLSRNSQLLCKWLAGPRSTSWSGPLAPKALERRRTTSATTGWRSNPSTHTRSWANSCSSLETPRSVTLGKAWWQLVREHN